MKFNIVNENEMLRLGAMLAGVIAAPAIIYLQGQLGTGKTTLVRGYLKALGCQEHVKSPTYTLVEPYKLGATSYFHFDLYRMKCPEELEELGIRDYLDNASISFFEWPDKGFPILPEADLTVEINSNQHASDRELIIFPSHPRAEQWLTQLKL